jgi:hypothetical protein
MKKSVRKQVKEYLLERMGYWNYIKEINDNFIVHRSGFVEYVAYGTEHYFHIDDMDESGD